MAIKFQCFNMANHISEVLKFEELRLNIDSRKVFIKNRIIRLRNKEFSLLEFFMRNVGKVVTRTQILEEVWDRNIFCPTNTVDVHISKLRSKICKNLKLPVIKTIHCIGYVFGD